MLLSLGLATGARANQPASDSARMGTSVLPVQASAGVTRLVADRPGPDAGPTNGPDGRAGGPGTGGGADPMGGGPGGGQRPWGNMGNGAGQGNANPMMGMGMMQQVVMTVAPDGSLYILRGNSLYKYSSDLKLLSSATLPNPPMPVGMGGMRGPNGGMNRPDGMGGMDGMGGPNGQNPPPPAGGDNPPRR